ncbi:amidohydrolase family protein [Geodermatophilus sp. SYSU D00703]
MTAVDLSDVTVVDGHCHAVERAPDADPAAWRGRFTESPDPVARARDAGRTAFYGRLLRAMAAFHGVPAEEDAVLAARGRLGPGELVARLFADAAIGGVVVDTGFPDPAAAMPGEAFDACSGAHRVRLLRLEVLFQDLVAEHRRYADLVDAVRAATADVRAAGYAGLKSIAGYRTGLGIERWSEADARAAFRAARAEVAAGGRVRLGHKPLLDSLLHLALAAAAAQELPVQFHVGYGDPDVDLRRASPLELRAVLEEPAYRPVPVVLLHGCWPYVREGAFLASVYGNAHLDLSYAIPFLSTGELRSMTRAALGAAPFPKLAYSSDGTGVPELHWLGARTGRALVEAVLGELVADGDLSADDARRAGELVLRDNAAALYGVDGMRR